MDRTEMIERLEKIAKHAVHTLGEEPFFMSLDDGIAVKEAIEIISAQPQAIRPKFVAEDRFVKNYFATYPHCPKCNYELETGDCYCRVCGCHIDWSEEDG